MSIISLYENTADKLNSKAEGLGFLSPNLWLRLAVALVFFKSGLTKIGNMQTTVFLFEHEYKVPLLDPTIAAYLGTWAELILPVLLAVGLLTRLSAFALFGFNLVAVISYLHGLNTWGYVDHALWGFMLLSIMFFGAGKIALDQLIFKRH
ncbi:MAG: DoxX family protein [Pseudomonadota bacterium]